MKHYFSFSISFKSFYIEKINKRNKSECKKIKNKNECNFRGKKPWEDTLWLHFKGFKYVYMSNT